MLYKIVKDGKSVESESLTLARKKAQAKGWNVVQWHYSGLVFYTDKAGNKVAHVTPDDTRW